MPAGLLSYLSPEVGGLVATLSYIGYQLYAPKYLDHDTALAPIVRDVPEQVDEMQEEQEDLREDFEGVHDQAERIDKKQTMMMQVQRAQAREIEGIDEERVDEYLVRNGVPVNEFQKDNDADEQ